MARVIFRINALLGKGEIQMARQLIERHVEDFNDVDNYIKLCDGARVILRIVRKSLNVTDNTVNRHDMLVLAEINRASNNFDISALKVLIKNSGASLHKSDAISYLSDTAKSVLTSLGLGRLVTEQGKLGLSEVDVVREIENTLKQSKRVAVSTDVDATGKKGVRVHGRYRS